MAKPFRVKRKGKYIGSWKLNLPESKGGGVVNLETQDAEEARRRTRRALAGDFGWQSAAADAVKETLDGDEGAAVEIEETGEGSISSSPAPLEPAAPVAAAEGVAGAAVPPSTPVPEAPGVDPVAAANETAAGMVDELQETLGAAGVDLGELMSPESLGSLHIGLQDVLFQAVAPLVTERKPKPFELPEKFAGAVKVLGQAWQQQLAKWNVSLDGVSPGSLIMLATAGMLAAQIVALYKPEPEPAQDGAAGVA